MQLCQYPHQILPPLPSGSSEVNQDRKPSKRHLAITESSEADRKRFVDRLVKPSDDECWIWTGMVDRKGYGRITVGGYSLSCHRFSFFIHNKYLDPDRLVCHSCDNPPCSNPSHLFLGTFSDNMKDASRKMRCSGQLRTHCPKGHEYTPENTYIHGDPKKGRQCKECRRISCRAYKLAKKMQKPK
jgi:hypothetical protein